MAHSQFGMKNLHQLRRRGAASQPRLQSGRGGRRREAASGFTNFSAASRCVPQPYPGQLDRFDVLYEVIGLIGPRADSNQRPSG